MRILYQDQLLPREETRISPDDRGYYFGDGVYEVFRIYKGKLFEVDAHMRRLIRTAEAVRIPVPKTPGELVAQMERLLQSEGVEEGTLYMQITRGEAPRTHPFPKQAEPVLMAYCTEVKRPLDTMKNGITAVTAEDIRWLRCDLKTLNLLPNVLAKQEALDRGAQDAVLHRQGRVTECTSSNIMIVEQGVIRTHPADNYILHGVTRAFVLGLARKLELPVREEAFTVEELLRADEAFITGTTLEVTPVVSVDGNPIGGGRLGPVARKLQEAFEDAIERL